MQRLLSHSQNFLNNQDIAIQLVAFSNVTEGDFVIEIGPGKGIITKEILKATKNLVAIEVDREMCEGLKGAVENLLNEDFLNFELPKVPFHVVSNIPFNMTSDILKKLLSNEYFQSATLIIQKEAIERYIPSKTQISVEYGPFFEFEILEGIDNKNFTPRPNVDIVIAKIERREKALIKEKVEYLSFVSFCFNSWKENLLKSLEKLFTFKQIQKIRSNLKISSQTPSELTLNQWIGLFDTYKNFCPDEKKKIVLEFSKKYKQQKENLQKRHRTTITS